MPHAVKRKVGAAGKLIRKSGSDRLAVIGREFAKLFEGPMTYGRKNNACCAVGDDPVATGAARWGERFEPAPALTDRDSPAHRAARVPAAAGDWTRAATSSAMSFVATASFLPSTASPSPSITAQ